MSNIIELVDKRTAEPKNSFSSLTWRRNEIILDHGRTMGPTMVLVHELIVGLN